MHVTAGPAGTSDELVIWGASGNARVVADIVVLTGKFTIAGFLDDVDPGRGGEAFCGAEILGGREQLSPLVARGINHIILGFGNCQARLELAPLVRRHGFKLAAAVNPQAVIASDVSIGPGSVVMAGAVVNPGTTIGENVIVNTSCSVDHDCVIQSGAHIGPRRAFCCGAFTCRTTRTPLHPADAKLFSIRSHPPIRRLRALGPARTCIFRCPFLAPCDLSLQVGPRLSLADRSPWNR